MAKNKKDRLLKLIKSALELYNDKGNIINGDIYDRKAILMTNILNDPKIFDLNSNLDNLKFRAKKTFYYGWKNEVFNNLRENYDVNSITLEIFFEGLDKYIELIKNKPLEDYIIITPINIIFKKKLPQKFLTLKKGVQISLENSNFFREEYFDKINSYKKNTYNQYVDKNVLNLLDNIEYPKCSYFIIKIKARDKFYLSKIVANTVDINLGIFCFIKYSPVRTIRIRVSDFIRQNITDINAPVIFVVKNNDVDNILFSSFENFASFKNFKENEIDLFKGIIESIENIKNDKLRFIITESFKLYYLALYNTEISGSFLKFWNIIEILLLKRADVKEEIIIKRLKSLFKSEYKEDFDDMIDLIYSKRNLYVHEALDMINEADRDFIKFVSENLINFFLQASQEVEEVGLLEFLYDNMNKREDILDKETKILKLIKRIKSPDAELDSN